MSFFIRKYNFDGCKPNVVSVHVDFTGEYPPDRIFDIETLCRDHRIFPAI